MSERASERAIMGIKEKGRKGRKKVMSEGEGADGGGTRLTVRGELVGHLGPAKGPRREAGPQVRSG